MAQERLRFDFRHTIVYYQTDVNAVGATTSLTLRTGLAVPGANDAYVRKYGVPYSILNVVTASKTVARGAVGNIGRFDFYGTTTGVHYGHIIDNGASAYTDDAAVAIAEPLRIRLTCTAGTYTVNNADTITITTNLDAGWLIRLSGETVTAAGGEYCDWYVANGGATYYDAVLKHGGQAHVPALFSTRYPYTTIGAALTAITVAGGTIIEVLDSEVYPEPSLQIGFSYTLQASLGQTPEMCTVIGGNAKHQLQDIAVSNNSGVVYISPTGTPGADGRWQTPISSITAGIARAVARGLVVVMVGGSGCAANPIFNEIVALNSRTICADWEILPRIRNTGSGDHVTATGAGANCGVLDFELMGGGSNGVTGGALAVTVKRCTVRGYTAGIRLTTNTSVAQYNRVESCTYGIYNITGTTPNIAYNNIFTCQQGIRWDIVLAAGASITGNVTWKCIAGIYVPNPGNINSAGALNHNTIYGFLDGVTTYGIWCGLAGPMANPFLTTIVTNCTYGVWANGGGTQVGVTTCSIAWNTNPTGGAGAVNQIGAIAGDPLLTDPEFYFMGTRPGSPCYHTDGAGNHVGAMGALARNVLRLAANNIVIDGFVFDNEDAMLPVLSVIAARTGVTVKWCTFRYNDGISVDGWSVGVGALNWIVRNCRFENCANPVYQFGTGSSVTYCLAYGTHGYAFSMNGDGGTMANLTAYQGRIGVYLLAGTYSCAVFDCIFSQQSEYAVWATNSITIDYCCIDGVVTLGVTTTPTDLFVNPLFVSTVVGSEDFHLRTIEGGYPFGSPAEGAGDTGDDMGCYIVLRGVTDDTWDSFQMDRQSSGEITISLEPKSPISQETMTGDSALSGSAHKRKIDISFPPDMATTAHDRDWLEHLSTITWDDEEELSREQSLIRVHLRPTEWVYPGTGVVDAMTVGLVATATETLYVAAANYPRNKFKGWHVSILWRNQIDGVVDAVNKTVTSAGAAWVVDEWAGYWIRQDVTETCGTVGWNYFRILSNTANVLTLSDPYDRLVTVGAAFDLRIESYHKCTRNDATYLYLLDPDGLLRDGENPYWYVDFMVCRLKESGSTTRGQMGARPDVQYDALPDRLAFEEAETCL